MTEKELERFQVVEKLTCDAGHQAGCHHQQHGCSHHLHHLYWYDQLYVTKVIVILNWVLSDHLDSNPLGSKAPSTSLERGAHLWGTSLSRSQQVQQL